MAPACWFHGGRVEKRNNGLCSPFCLGESCPPALALMPDTSVPSSMPLVLFKLLPQFWISEGVSLSPCVGSLRGTAWDSRSFFHQLNPYWCLQPEVIGTYLPGTGTLYLGGLVWDWDSWLPRNSSRIFTHYMWVRDQPVLCLRISTSPTSLDGCGFFNSVVVGLPFSSIYDSSE